MKHRLGGKVFKILGHCIKKNKIYPIEKAKISPPQEMLWYLISGGGVGAEVFKSNQ